MTAVFDRRRIAAPELSAPLQYSGEPSSSKMASEVEYLQTGLTNQANGSSYLESGNIKIACSVYGPRPKAPPYTPQGSLNLEVKFTPFASPVRRAPLRDTEPVTLSHSLHDLLLPVLQLHLLPKSSLDIFVLILESDHTDRILAAGVTVVSAALADAGIPINALCVGESLAEEAEDARSMTPRLTAGVMPALNQYSNLFFTGEAGVEQVYKMLDAVTTKARAVHGRLAASLLETTVV